LAQDPAPTSVVVVVVGGDAVVGQALELLLRSTDCSVKFLAEPYLNAPGSLDGAQLLVLAPGLGAQKRKAILESVRSEPTMRSTSVVELASDARASQLEERHFLVPWPCRTEDLRQQVEAALLAGSGASKAATQTRVLGESEDQGA
jgi:hypothetical protein